MRENKYVFFKWKHCKTMPLRKCTMIIGWHYFSNSFTLQIYNILNLLQLNILLMVSAAYVIADAVYNAIL